MKHFKALIKIIGVNPYVTVPEEILAHLFGEHGADKGPIPIHGVLNAKPFKQTLVKFQGEWRLYINTTMLKNSPKRVGEQVELDIDYDPVPRDIPMPIELKKALEETTSAKQVFDSLPPYHQKEIVRYIAKLKKKEIVALNVERAIGYLLGKNRFIGRAPVEQKYMEN